MGLIQDVRSAARNIARAPLAALVVVLSLAGGIGAATSALLVRNVIFHNPPPLYRDPSALSRVQAAPRDRVILPGGSPVPSPLFALWREDSRTTLAAAGDGSSGEIRVADRTDVATVRPATANLFDVLGVQPLHGRTFSAPGTEPAVPEAILSHRVWERLFGLRDDAIGAAITIEGQPYVVIGVMPERFWFGATDSPIWTRLDERRLPPTAALRVVARRMPGTTDDGLSAQLQAGLAAYNGRLAPGATPLHIRVSPVRGTPMAEQVAPVLPYLLGVAVLLVLLIGCANSAIVLIAQWAARETETAVRSSLGASRLRLVRSLVTEAVMLSVSAGILGVVVTLALRWWLMRNTGGNGVLDLSIPGRVFLQVAGLAFAAGIVAGLAPAAYETRRLQLNPLRGLQASDRLRQRWSHTLVVLEISITVALLVVTSSMVAGYQRLRDAQFGFDLAPLAFTQVTSAAAVHPSLVLDRLRGTPGIGAAAIGTSVPLFLGRAQQTVSAEPAATDTVRAQQTAIAGAYFETLGVPMRDGRAFTPGEPAHHAIVNEAFARRLYGGSAVIGRQFWVDRRPYDVIGVVADFATTFSESERVAPKFFLPLGEVAAGARLAVLIRAAGRPEAIARPLQRELRDLLPGARVADPNTYAGLMEFVGQEWLLSIAPLGPLVAMGTLLSTVGLYGILAFAVARRSRELAVRVALGASAWGQIRLIAGRSLRLVLAGTALGIAFTFALSRVVRAFGGGGSMYDPPPAAFVLPLALMLIVCAAATWVPSLRARRIDPAAVLKGA